jgi:hypothetical protein
MIRRKNVAGLLVLAILIAGMTGGCAWLKTTTTGFTDMTPKQKSTFFMGVYNRNFNDTMAMASMPVLTDDQKTIVRTKKAVLTKMRPVVYAYDAIVATGGTPSATQEAELIRMVDELATAGVK